MAKKEQNIKTEDKPLTKYDMKVKKREAAKRKAKKDKANGIILGVAIVIILAAMVAYFPIRNYMTVNGAYIKIDGQSISRVEYDYNYNVTVTNYLNNYGSYLSYFGIDTSSDFSNEMYDENLTWGDFFDKMTVESLSSIVAMEREMMAAGFTCETDEKYQAFADSAASAAEDQGISLKEYISKTFGDYATLKRLEPFIRKSVMVNEYYDEVQETKIPGFEEINAYYEEHKNDYDSIDYYQTVVKATLPTEPTELADEEPSYDDDGNYIPSDAEVESAMKAAYEDAQSKESFVTMEGTLKEGASYSGTSYLIRDWLYDEARAEGDKTIIEDESSNQYYVLGFKARFLIDDPTVAAHFIILTPDEEGKLTANGDDILAEWAAGEATEESFAEIADKYNEVTVMSLEGGYIEAATKTGMAVDLSDWLYADGRKAGDTGVIASEDGNTYVVYFTAYGDEEWYISIKNTLTSDNMSAYLDEITAGMEVKDLKNALRYISIENALAETSEETQE